MWQIAKSLRPHPLSVGQARRFVTSRLLSVLHDRAGVQPAVDDAAAITSELVTNAINAGARSVVLSLALLPDRVRIEVIDDAGGSVTPADPQLTDVHGRGLLVVAALAAEWGVGDEPDGKLVWADVRVPARQRPKAATV